MGGEPVPRSGFPRSDINQDGVVGALLGPGIYDGRDGTPWEMPEDWDDTIIPIVADLEADGQHEVITRGAIYEQDMTLRCRFGWAAEALQWQSRRRWRGGLVLSGSRAVTIVDSQCRQRSTSSRTPVPAVRPSPL